MKNVLVGLSQDERIALRFGNADEIQRILAEKKFAKKPFSTGNSKVGRMGTFSKPYGNDVIVSPTYGAITGSCGHHCEACKDGDGRYMCYVESSMRYDSVRDNHVRNALVFLRGLDKAFRMIEKHMQRKRKPYEFLRINQSGEIESREELLHWAGLAEKFPKTYEYLYTKAYEILEYVLIHHGDRLPKNFTILVSIWHHSGIEFYKKWRGHPNLKFFVVVDKVWTIERYAQEGIDIEVMCPAYDENGKVDHDATCDVCQFCMRSPYTVIGCWEH